ncbi:MAG: thiamine-phosphate kinase [Gammaproteobacteria bacterium]|nr:thiamine-phosphate kinase [Gammaproteobacteria bacterium]
MHRETEIIRRYFDRQRNNGGVIIGIGDDAAAVKLPAGVELISAIDTIVEGVHFPRGFPANDIGYRVLAVNLSDFAAMGAQPAWALLSLSMPSLDELWLESFCDSFFELADAHAVVLIGGDLVSGPLAATVTLLGSVPEDAAITRDGAQPGEIVYVTGSPGAAALGLQSVMKHSECPQMERYFRRPVPRITEGRALRGIASSMIDLSDGLLTDARHIAEESAVQITLDAAALNDTVSGELLPALCGGDDYELLFTVPTGKEQALAALATNWDCAVSRVGRVGTGEGVTLPGYDLENLSGYDHFSV